MCEHLSNLDVHLSYFLKYKSCDMLSGLDDFKGMTAQIEVKRNDHVIYDAIFEEAVNRTVYIQYLIPINC